VINSFVNSIVINSSLFLLNQRVQSLMSLDVAMTSVQEKLSQLESSIEQRLKWAAGANPSLNPILENFEHTLKERKRLIVVCVWSL
jgi:PI-3-kinase-related kinase SMG-1